MEMWNGEQATTEEEPKRGVMRGRGWTLLISNFRNPAGFLKFEYVNVVVYFLELGSDVDVTARQIPKSKGGS